MLKLVFISLLNIGIIQYVNGVCNSCEGNSVIACISQTEFHPCIGGVPDTSQTFSCPGPNQICTSKPFGCYDTTSGSNVKPACGDTSICGVCNGVGTHYTCTSRTTFTMCFDEDRSEIRLSCKEKELCNVAEATAGNWPCVAECEENDIELCDLNDPIDAPATTVAPTTTTQLTTTTEEVTSSTITTITTVTATEEIPVTTEQVPTTSTTERDTSTTTVTTEDVRTTTEEITTTTIYAPTPPLATTTTTVEATTTTELPTTTTTENPANLVCSQQTVVGRYPHPYDTSCKTYIYCFLKGGVMQASIMECPAQRYFNSLTRLCAELKPEGCI